jgi:UPF0755 protein
VKRLLVLAAIAAVLGCAAVGGALGWSLRRPSDTPKQVVFEVPRGATLEGIARELEDEGLIRSQLGFRILARISGRAGGLRAGEYALSPTLAADQVLDRLTRGTVMTHRVALPEGLTLREIAARFEEAGLVSADEFIAVTTDPTLPVLLGVDGTTLEGYLFPETYELAKGLAAREIARLMVEQFQRVWRRIEPLASAKALSMRDVVVLASIVEKETGAPGERPMVAAVFHNRLKRGMRLETDPSVIYGIPDFDGNLRRVHLEDESNPYNTYRISGLPPGPIANPGELALRAVVEPAKSDYLFFVARNDGTHKFSRTYREHVNAVNRYQRGGAK